MEILTAEVWTVEFRSTSNIYRIKLCVEFLILCVASVKLTAGQGRKISSNRCAAIAKFSFAEEVGVEILLNLKRCAIAIFIYDTECKRKLYGLQCELGGLCLIVHVQVICFGAL